MAWMRFAGLTRGVSDFVLPEARQLGVTSAFYSFHPDEDTLIQAALNLNWRSPFEPPLTSYGLLPIYMARGVLVGEDTLDTSIDARRRIYLRVRLLSALLSCALPGLVFWLGRRGLGTAPALLAATFVAFAPLAVQQAHFFTVDGVFIFFVMLFFCALSRALNKPTYGRYLLTGLAIGMAAAVRLNGGVLGLVLVVGHCSGGWRQVPARLKEHRLWLAVLVALAILLVLQPYLLFNPSRLLRSVSTNDFSYSVAVATGELLRFWSLADMHTVPYLHYWTHLWPQGVGWPLTFAYASGLLWALWCHRRDERPAIVWTLLYFALVGNLHTKHVRYLLPLLPFLSLFAAGLCWSLWRRHRLVGIGVAVALAVFTAIYGLAFTHIYRHQDSRIEAARFLAAHAPVGAQIGLERGGFSMSQLISNSRYSHLSMDMGTLFGARYYLSCAAAIDYIGERVRLMDYIVVEDVNRYRQFTAVPEMFPVASAFYRGLWDESLGFVRDARFKVYPQILGISFSDDDSEVSFVGYDHPAVSVFRRQTEAEWVTRWTVWRQGLLQDGICADNLLVEVADRYRLGDWQRALAGLDELLINGPENRTVHFLQGRIYHQLGMADQEMQAIDRYVAGYIEENAYLVPWATAATLLALDLPELALAALRHGVQLQGRFADEQRRLLAASYIHAGTRARELGYLAHAVEIYRLSSEISPTSQTYMLEGMALFDQGLVESSSLAYERALALDAENESAGVNYGWNLYLEGRSADAADQFRQVLRLGANSVAAFNLGLALLAQGQVESAVVAYGKAVAEYGAATAVQLGAVEELRAEVERQGGLGRGILRQHWEESADE